MKNETDYKADNTRYCGSGINLVCWGYGLILGPADADKTVDVGPPNPALDAGDVAALFGTSDLTLLYKSNYEARKKAPTNPSTPPVSPETLTTR